MRVLQHWYGGCCFDGASVCYFLTPVLAALAAGHVSITGIDASVSLNWLGLLPAAVLQQRFAPEAPAAELTPYIADLGTKAVNATALLLQTGLLSLEPSVRDATCALLRPPNQYSRNLVLQLSAQLTAHSQYELVKWHLRLQDAIPSRDHEGFGAALFELLAGVCRAAPVSIGATLT
jgi:hypothetical protein